MGEVASSRGDVPEPFWRAAIGIAKFTVEGAEAAHMLSDGYDGYDFDETQAKFDNWTTGPSTCAEFSKHTKACASCPHNGKIKSPAVLGYMTPEVGSVVPTNALQCDLGDHVVSWGPTDPVPKDHAFAIGEGRTGIAPLGAVSSLAAPGGNMKTALAMSLGLHIATGTHWAGHRVDAGAVLFLQLEDDADECRRRAGATLAAQIDPALHGDAAKRLQLVAMPGVDARLTRVVYGASERTGMAARVIAQAQRLADECGLPVRLIVVDHSRLAIGGDANDSSHVTELLRALAHIAKVTGAAVLLLCHSPKSSLNPKHSDEYSAVDVLGSGAFVDNARFAGVITPVTEDERKKFGLDPAAARKHLAFRVIKSNYSEAGGVVYLRKTPVIGWGVAVPDAVQLAMPIAAAASGPIAPAGAKKLTALLAQHPGRFTKSSLRHQAGKDGPLGMGEKAVAQALSSLTATGVVVARTPSPDEVEQFGHGHQVTEVLHVV
jgi:hypothetical protein